LLISFDEESSYTEVLGESKAIDQLLVLYDIIGGWELKLDSIL
jgi:hypothetical protein